MNKAEFLAWAAAHTPWTPLPVPEILDAWQDDLEEVWRYHFDFYLNVWQGVCKGGRIWVPMERLREYSQALTTEEQVAFYWELRRSRPWREPEFRPDFERGFPGCVGLLPPPMTPEEADRAWEEVSRREPTAIASPAKEEPPWPSDEHIPF
jgi:hypothetical protein